MKPTKLVKGNMATLEADFDRSGKQDKIYFDTEIEGFGLRFRVGGSRIWILQYKRGGVQRRLTLGPLNVLDPADARDMARDKLADVWKGNDPAAQRQEAKLKAKVTLRVVIDNFLAAKQSKLRPRSFIETEHYLLESWKPLHGYPIDKISRQQVASILDQLEKVGSERTTPVAAARARSNLSTLFAWAMGRGYVDHNIVVGTNNPDAKLARERVLTSAELKAIWSACDKKGNGYSAVVRLLILTGCRREEIGGLRWSELDRDAGTWTLPGSRSKNKREHTLTLPSLAWQVIDGVGRRPGIDHLFGKRGFTGWANSKGRLDKRCEVTEWRLHDLRRTVATRMADLGVQPHIIEAVLNHYSGHRAGVAGVYNRSPYAREVKVALELWADHIRSITTGAERKVIQMTPIPA